MAPKEPTRHQLSSRLAYQQHTPAFLLRLQSKVTGDADDEEDDDFYEWQDKSGRPPIPRRPTPPERPADDPGSADEDDLDEKPQVVVLRKGKHLTAEEAERYAENERRKEQGLPPLSATLKAEKSAEKNDSSTSKEKSDERETKSKSSSLSFSSSGATSTTRGSTKKRKVVGDGLDDLLSKEAKAKVKKKGKQSSKAKKAKTGTLLSFGEDDT
ncbi:hypothetical protein ACEPAI_6835 [Sanghuangporus weigelae]